MATNKLIASVLTVTALLLAAPSALRAQYAISLVAGGGPNGLSPLASSLGFPGGIAQDSTGNIYIADVDSSRVLVINSTGTPTVTVFAGNGSGSAGEGGYSGDGGLAINAQLGRPDSVAVDASGNVFIADTDNSVIREVASGTGIITTVAGTYYPPTQACSYSGDNGPATSAYLCRPGGLFVDAAGDIFIADTENSVIRKVVAGTGVIQTVAGYGTPCTTAAIPCGDGSAATSAQLQYPYGVFVDAAGDIFIADTEDDVIREVVQTTGIIQTVAGSFTLGPGYSGDTGPATAAQLDFPMDVFVDGSGDIFISDSLNSVVREVTGGIIQTVAGNFASGAGYSGDGGLATSAQIDLPNGLLVDGSGSLFFADSNNFVLREVSGGTIQTIAGDKTVAYSGDGAAATNASLSPPGSVFVDAAGNLFIADTDSSVIREVVAASGKIQTVAGSASLGAGYTGDGSAATSAQLDSPYGVFADSQGDIFIADTENSVVRCVVGAPGGCFGSALPVGSITTVAGTGAPGYSGDGSAATLAELLNPYGIYVDSQGDLFIADTENSVIRCVVGAANGCFGSALGVGSITTVAGNGTPCEPAGGACGDGAAATAAELNFPAGVFGDSAGDLFIADTFNSKIREVAASTGIIQTVAGSTSVGYAGDGAAATLAQLDTPYGVFVDRFGNIFIADTDNSVVREVVASTGFIQTIAGDATEGYSGDGGSAIGAQLFRPLSVAGDASGDLFIADSENLRIRKLISTVTVSLIPTSATLPTGGTQQFAATVTGATDTSVTWQVNGVTGGNSTSGAISTSGLYQAPAAVPTSPTVTVTAIANANGVTSASASVTIVAGATNPTVTISTNPAVTQVYTGATQTFIANVTDTAANPAVDWQVNGVTGGNSTVGTISTDGVYTAPATVPAPATVVIGAVLQADSSVSGSYPITVVVAPAATQPPAQTLSAGGSANYSMSLQPNTGAANQVITLSCLGSSLPLGATCAFSPATITPGVSAVPFALTISLPACTASLEKPNGAFLAVFFFPAFGLLFAGFGKGGQRRKWLLMLVLLCAPLTLWIGCSSGAPKSSACTSPTGTYNVVVQGTTPAQPQAITIVTVSLTVQ